MDIQIKKYNHQHHRDYCEITLINDAGMQVKILNYGATLEKILLPRDGQLENVILSLADSTDYTKERNYLGGTVGRIVGRVRAGQWQLGDRIVQLPLNDGANHIHGGHGTDTQVFDFQPIVTAEHAQVRLTLVDAANHNGYPGNLKLTVTYTLDNKNRLAYQIEATSDAPTILNPTNHVYFRLDGPSSDVTNLQLQLSSDAYLPLDAASLPFKGRRPVAHTSFDFRHGQRLGDVLTAADPEIAAERGLNHPFLLNGHQPAATLTSPTRHIKMTLATNAPAVVVYTANHFDHTGLVTSHIGQYDGVALECQFAPQEDPQLTPFVLLPTEKFNRWIDWQFTF